MLASSEAAFTAAASPWVIDFPSVLSHKTFRCRVLARNRLFICGITTTQKVLLPYWIMPIMLANWNENFFPVFSRVHQIFCRFLSCALHRLPHHFTAPWRTAPHRYWMLKREPRAACRMHFTSTVLRCSSRVSQNELVGKCFDGVFLFCGRALPLSSIRHGNQ